MKVVVQRVSKASVRINNEVFSSISYGLLVLLGIESGDNDETIRWMSNKLMNLRIFPDESNKMNCSVRDVNGEILIVSNFTLYGDVRRGFRPSFTEAALPDLAENIYNRMINHIKEIYPINIETGIFGAMMEIESVNSGPVTIIIEKENL